MKGDGKGPRVCSVEGCERLETARGMCPACYTRWKRATNHNGFRDREAAKDKADRLSEAGDAKERARMERRRSAPGFTERRREIHRDFTDRHDPIGIGKAVEVALADLAEFSPNRKRPFRPCQEESPLTIRGTVVGRGRSVRLVRFATFEEWVFTPRIRTPKRAVNG